jgi:hypothetical protein
MEFKHDYRNRYHTFYDLMEYTVKEILLVSSLYDDFILEEDGRLSEEMFTAYSKLDLSSPPPRITRVSTGSDALELIQQKKFDLIVTMRRLTDIDPFDFGKKVKAIDPNYPVILLLTSFAEITGISPDYKSCIDAVFVFSGNSDIILAIIKLIEDQRNIANDILHGQVRAIIVVEDTIQYYSLFLPLIYRELIKQTRKLMKEGVNSAHRQLKRKVRPKILLAESYEEAVILYEKYKDYLLGIISDVGFPRNGEKDFNAGYDLIKHVRTEKEYLPILIQSSDPANRKKAQELQAEFVHKNTPDYLRKFRQFMKDHLLLGDFKFKGNDGEIIDTAENLIEFEEKLSNIPLESIKFHGSKNHFSNWLYARGEFVIANKLASYRITDFPNIAKIRHFLLESIKETRIEKKRGVITEFSRSDFDFSFTRIGRDSLGGKGRGLAFISNLLIESELSSQFSNIDISIPNTIIIATDLFDQFLDENDLYSVALTDVEDDTIFDKFLESKLPEDLELDLEVIIDQVKTPLAVRSSSLLEDSQYLPFAGIYHTYFLSNDQSSRSKRLAFLSQAIKLVYASTFTKLAKRYIQSIGQRIEVEKMAVILQEVVGKKHQDRFYPDFSGVAESWNYYPVGYMEPEDGIAQIAIGLGEMVVSGCKVLSFCPKYPKILPHLSNPKDALKNSQIDFYSLQLNEDSVDLRSGEYSTLSKNPILKAKEDGVLQWLASTYDGQNNRIVDTIDRDGPILITFPYILQHNRFPLSAILTELLIMGNKSFGTSVEIEFAVNLDTITDEHVFSVLQIRPLAMKENHFEGEISQDKDRSVVFTNKALGNGRFTTIQDIVYVIPERFDNTKTLEIRDEISVFNEALSGEQREYVLIGFGRWGTRDPFLGIPVKWDDIHFSRVIIEAALKDFQIDPSQGMHFFTNIISAGKGYFTVSFESTENQYINWDWLDGQKVVKETEYVKHVRLAKPLEVLINGKTSTGCILKPEH